MQSRFARLSMRPYGSGCECVYRAIFLVLMFTYYWKLALMMLAIIPFYILFYWLSNRINKRLQRQLMENSAELEAQLVESLNAVATIKRFGMESYANYKTETRFIQLIRPCTIRSWRPCR